MSDNDIIVTRMARIVGPEGNSTARIAIVADAPDTVSMAKGRPFMGAAGDLLTDCLIAAGLSRKDTYITYVVKEQPEGNNINAFLDLSKKYPVESPAYQEYVAALVKEFNHNRSNVIVACGPVALYALTGKKGLTNWRGSIIESTLLPGRKVIPILEPASALKQYVWKHLIIFDLQKVAKEMDSPAMPVDNRKYILGPTFAECVNFLEVCAHSELVAFDIEVSGTEVSCISFAYDAETAISIPFVASGKDYFSPEQETTIWELIAQVLENEQVQKVGQNVTFDTTFIFNKYGIAPCNLHDTMVACAILFPDFPKGLAFITSIYTNVPYYKDEGHAQITGKVASHDKSFWLYNAKDSIVLMEAFPRMLDDLIKSHNIITYARQVGLVLPLVFMSSYGIAMDVEGLRKESEIAVARLAELQTELDTLTSARGVPTVNINSPLQVKRYFYEKCRERPSQNNGVDTVDEKALKRLATKGYREASIILEMRGLAKLNGTYFTMKLDEDERLRTSMNPVGTKTGRLSSSQTIFGTGANIQNQPRIMKKYMRTDPEMVAYSLDLSQAENRVVAYLGPDPKMIEAFTSGIDIHSRTASLIFGGPEDKKHHEETTAVLGNGQLSQRDWGKKANHGLNYGMMAQKAALLWEVPVEDARFVVDRYHAAYPGVRSYHEWVKEELRRTRTLTSLLGRARKFWTRWDETLFLEAYAFIPQSTIADVMNERGVMFVYNNTEIFEHARLMMTVHDSITYQVPASVPLWQHAEMLCELRLSLQQTLSFRGFDFSIPTDTSAHSRNLKDGVVVPKGTEIEIVYEQLKESFDSLGVVPTQ